MGPTGKCLSLAAVFGFAVLPLLPQTNPNPRLSFDVISIKPSAPGPGIRGGGARGDRYTMNGATPRMLVQNAYQKIAPTGPATPTQIVGGPSWMESDRYDVQATADCSAGILTREQLRQMIQAMLESRFQFKAHKETREPPSITLLSRKMAQSSRPPRIKRRLATAPADLRFHAVHRPPHQPLLRRHCHASRADEEG